MSKRIRTENVAEGDQAEYIEIQNPKHEPVEYISDTEDTNIKDESLHIIDQKQAYTNIATSATDTGGQDQGKNSFIFYYVFLTVNV